jgi:hypothetical protein
MKFDFFLFEENMRKIITVSKRKKIQNIIVEMYLIARFQCIFIQIFLN